MSLGVTLAVLGAGLLHAGWNALLKASPGGDALLDTASVVAGGALCALAAAAFLPPPSRAAWPYLAVSACLQTAYYLTLVQAYRSGDLSFAYPLMRGAAPLIVAVLGLLLLRELPSASLTLGILLVSLGIVSIAFVGQPAHPPAAARWALATAVLIAAYTLVDASGVRASGHPAGYVSWLLVAQAIPFLTWVAARRGRAALHYVRGKALFGLTCGACSLAAYGIVLWAMTQAPVAAVAALRETSVLFAALIGSLWFKERFGPLRLAGALCVVLGIAALRL